MEPLPVFTFYCAPRRLEGRALEKGHPKPNKLHNLSGLRAGIDLLEKCDDGRLLPYSFGGYWRVKRLWYRVKRPPFYPFEAFLRRRTSCNAPLRIKGAFTLTPLPRYFNARLTSAFFLKKAPPFLIGGLSLKRLEVWRLKIKRSEVVRERWT